MHFALVFDRTYTGAEEGHAVTVDADGAITWRDRSPEVAEFVLHEVELHGFDFEGVPRDTVSELVSTARSIVRDHARATRLQ